MTIYEITIRQTREAVVFIEEGDDFDLNDRQAKRRLEDGSVELVGENDWVDEDFDCDIYPVDDDDDIGRYWTGGDSGHWVEPGQEQER